MADKASHYFHAEAHALAGRLDLPFRQEIKKQAFVKLQGRLADLPDEEQMQLSYFSQNAENFRLEGIVSYAAAHTQVSGHLSKKHKGASVTLATSVVEDLNVLNVVTADRVVAQISTTHFPDDYTPEVTFLGTHFENLRIARHRAEPYLKLDACARKLTGKQMRLGHDADFQKTIEAQYQRLKAWLAGVTAEDRKKMRLGDADSLTKTYHGGALNFANLAEQAASAQAIDLDPAKGISDWSGITCSLVEHVDIKNISARGPDGKSVEIPPPGKACGHMIRIPEFGTIFLAEVRVNHNSYNLTMIRLELGCIADGDTSIGTCDVNGGHKPGGG